MSTTTPNLTLTLYDSTTDQVVTFATFRAVWGGTATTSNFYRIDTWAGTVNSSITTLQNQRGAITVPASYVSANYYEATVASITSYITGMTILLKLDTDSAGTVTLNINALGTKSVTKVNSSGLVVNIAGGELQSNRYYMFTYDGTQWVWVNANSADQVYHGGTSGNVVLVASDGSISDSSTPATVVGSAVYNATAKTTLANADTIGITDSAASNVLKKITWSNFQTAIGTALGTIINALTGKTTPVDADEFVAGDSASSYVSKKITLLAIKLAVYAGIKPPEGVVWNGRISASVSSNNLTVSLKTFDGTDPSSSNPVYVTIGGTVRTITSSLSVTKNAGTNWSNAGGTELATLEHDRFVYLGYNATDGVVIGHSRIPWGKLYSDFSATTTNETYCAISTITNAAAGDNYVNIGRFAATLSGGASYNWSVPSFNSSNLVQNPEFESRWLQWTIAYTGFTATTPTSNNYYKVVGDICFIHRDVLTNGVSNSTTFTLTFPFKFAAAAAIITWTGALDNGTLQSTPGQLQIVTAGSNVADAFKTFYQGAWTNTGNKNIYLLDFNYKLR